MFYRSERVLAQFAYCNVRNDVNEEFDSAEKTNLQIKVTALKNLQPLLGTEPILLKHYFHSREGSYVKNSGFGIIERHEPKDEYRFLDPTTMQLYQVTLRRRAYEPAPWYCYLDNWDSLSFTDKLLIRAHLFLDSNKLHFGGVDDGKQVSFDPKDIIHPEYAGDFYEIDIERLLDTLQPDLQHHPLVEKVKGDLGELDKQLKVQKDQIATKYAPYIKRRLMNLKKLVQEEGRVFPKYIPIGDYYLLSDEERLVSVTQTPYPTLIKGIFQRLRLKDSQPDFNQCVDLDPKEWVYNCRKIESVLVGSAKASEATLKRWLG